jgi:NTE family protein
MTAARRLRLVLAVALLVSAAEAPIASEVPPAGSVQTPRVALALSGGGARGIAHVGVLKVLEELRIPVHCVVGTSMGAIVGGTYAAGRSVDEMQTIVLEADWAEIFRDIPPRREIAVRRKIDDYKPLFGFELGVQNGSLALPKGLIAGVSIESFFREMAQPAASITDFDKLPVPFRAMATDLETGASVVLGKGNLAQAMRASMSVPGAIAPVEIDGRLLVDGGLADNLPIEVARRLCGDVVIAVNISTPPLRRDQITSARSVTSQMINFIGLQTVKDQLKTLTPQDVLIAPDLGDISASSFDRSRDAIRIGEEATRALADHLRRYSVPPEQYAAFRVQQLAEAKPLGKVDEVRVEGLQRTNPAVARALVESQPGQPLTEEKVAADLRRIFGTGDFEAITYRIVGGENGPRVLLIEPTEKSWGPNFVRFGLALASDFAGDNQFNAMVQYRRTWLNRLGAEWVSELQIGQNSFFRTEWYQPLNEAGKWFVAPTFYAGQQTRGVFINEDKVADYRVGVVQGGLDGGLRLGTWGQLRAGPVWSNVNARVDTGSPLLPTTRQNNAGLRAGLFIDQTDQAWFPRHGFAATGAAYSAMASLGSDVAYNRVELGARAVRSFGPHTFNLAVSAGSALGSDMPAYDSFTLGGPLRLSAYRLNELAGRQFTFSRLMYYNRRIELPDLLGSGVFVGGSAEVARMSDRADGLPAGGNAWSVSTFLAAVTFLGPAYLGVGVGPARWSIYLLLGAP